MMIPSRLVTWRHVISVLVIAGLMTGLGPSARSADDTHYPDAIKQDWDFGFLPQKGEVKHTFWVKNPQAEPIEVILVKSGCSCTQATDIKGVITPGDSVALEIVFKTGRYKGAVKKLTTILVASSKTPTHAFTLMGHIVQKPDELTPLRVDPMQLKWKVAGGDSVSVTDSVRLINEGTGEMEVRVLAASPFFESNPKTQTIAAGSEAWLKLSCQASVDKEARTGATVTLLVSGEETSHLTIPIKIDD